MKRLLLGAVLLILAGVLLAQPAAQLVHRAEAGDAKAQRELGRNYAAGIGVAADPQAALSWLLLAAQQGDLEAEVELGWLYSNLATDARNSDDADSWEQYAKYQHESLKWRRKSAARGGPVLQRQLADILWRRAGADNDADALSWYRMAAEQGAADAQTTLARLYAEGRGAARDRAESLRWYGAAAANGEAEAQYRIGLAYQHGRGLPKHPTQSTHWYTMAAEQGHARAMLALRSATAPGSAKTAKPLRPGWHRVVALVLRLELPSGAKRSGDPESADVHFVGPDVDVTVVSNATATVDANEPELRVGVDSYVRTRKRKDGGGEITVFWPDVGHLHSELQLVARFTNREGEKLATAIADGARLLDETADLTLVRTEPKHTPPSATLRSVDGQEREVHPQDFVSRDGAVVSAIARDQIELVDLHGDGAGGWVEKLITLQLEK